MIGREEFVITINVLQRIFQVKIQDQVGTAFAVDHLDQKYLITAKHLFKQSPQITSIQVFHNKEWKELAVQSIKNAGGIIDISVLLPATKLPDAHPLPITSAGISLGQDVFFLGFPYGLKTEVGQMNRNFPIPFVKKGIISSITFENNIQTIYVDGHNNPGFSGGPLVFSSPGKSEYKVAGVIAGYYFSNEKIYCGTKESPFTYEYNTGIVTAYGSKHIMELIETFKQ